MSGRVGAAVALTLIALPLVLAAWVAVVGVLVGSLGAFASVRRGRTIRAVIVGLMLLPAVVPTVVYALGLVLVSTQVPIVPWHLLVVGHAILATPLAFLVMRVGVQRFVQSWSSRRGCSALPVGSRS